MMRATISKWGVASIVLLLGVVPAIWVATLLPGGDRWQPDAIGLTFLLAAIWCGIAATRRGSRWWICIPIVAALWTCSIVSK